MIKIYFAPGCYGNYLGQCLYYFTNLSDQKIGNFEIDQTGSSHSFRYNSHAKKYLQVGHPAADTTASSQDILIAIINDSQHWLDYYNNHFIKQQQSQITKNISENFSLQEVENKLKNQWNYSGSLDHAPKWILREFLSLCIRDVLHNGYGTYNFDINTATATISTQDFFIDFLNQFKKLCSQLSLQINVNDDTIIANNKLFIDAQQYHGSQLACEHWAQSIINKIKAPSPIQTVIDEAYVQHCLRQLGYEIQCNDLDQFADSADKMADLIYKI